MQPVSKRIQRHTRAWKVTCFHVQYCTGAHCAAVACAICNVYTCNIQNLIECSALHWSCGAGNENRGFQWHGQGLGTAWEAVPPLRVCIVGAFFCLSTLQRFCMYRAALRHDLARSEKPFFRSVFLLGSAITCNSLQVPKFQTETSGGMGSVWAARVSDQAVASRQMEIESKSRKLEELCIVGVCRSLGHEAA